MLSIIFQLPPFVVCCFCLLWEIPCAAYDCNWVIFCAHSVRGWHFNASISPSGISYAACYLIFCLMRISEVISVKFGWHLPT